MNERIQKLISRAGFSSRRRSELLIKEGRVLVNGKLASLGDKADPLLDQISVDGKIIEPLRKVKVILINKPVGVISTCKDPEGRKTVKDLLPISLQRGLYPIGRLDLDSRGALLLSNNGELTMKLTHPKFKHEKIYHVWVSGIPSLSSLRSWRAGITIDKNKTLPSKVDIKKINQDKNVSQLKIVLREGRNRQIRKAAEYFGHSVIDLKRVSIASIALGNLREGEWRELQEEEWINLI